MASLTMMASLSAVAVDRRVQQPRRRLAVAARVAARVAAKVDCNPAAAATTKMQHAEEYYISSAGEGRRAVVFAAAAAALSAIGVGASSSAAFAGPDVKRGTPEAKKKYATVCVTMPTAKVCHN